MKRYLFKSMLSLGAATLLVACSEDDILDGDGNVPGGYSDKVCFVVSDNNATRGGSTESRRCGGIVLHSDDGKDSIFLAMTVSDEPPATRASYITAENYNTLSMTCRRRIENNKYDYYFADTKYTKNAGGEWVSDPTYYWPNKETHFNFYGYAPTNAQGVTFNKDEQTWEPKLDYTVPATAQDQSDIVYNTNTREYIIASMSDAVPLSMSHALANVAFKTGTGMAAGTINSVTLNNVVNKGSLNLTNGAWTLDPQSKGSFKLENMNKPMADGQELNTNADKTYFMLLPGSTTEETEVAVNFTKADGTEDTFTGKLTGNWEAGKQYMYTVTVCPDFTITVDSDVQDAHYVMCHGQVTAANMQQGQEWVLTASIIDPDPSTDLNTDERDKLVTLLHASELKQWHRDGFWTDLVWEQGVNDTEPHATDKSARGLPTLTGTGNSDFYIFIPENIDKEDHIIRLSMKVNGSEHEIATYDIKQLCPDGFKNGNDFGWEQIENDPLSDWGFSWDRTVTYKKANIMLNAWVYYPLIQDLVKQNKAENYTTVNHNGSTGGWLPIGTGGQTSIKIEYTKLNNLSTLGLTNSDGLDNTRKLYGFAGGASTGDQLEQAIIDLAQQGYSDWGVFDKTQESGTNSMTTAVALGHILLKNRYNLVRISREDNGVTVTTETPALNTDEGIVWYMPAKDQFLQGPTQNSLVNEPTDYWSSTPVENSSRIYTSTGQTERTYNRKIRACRQNPEKPSAAQ